MFYKTILKPLFFCLSPEKAHHLTMRWFQAALTLPFGKKILSTYFTLKDKKLARTVFGLNFPNPVGLAAGFDKNGQYIEALEALGFGFIEVGTVTPRPQDGNPQPRLFRLPDDHALINRMGFNNEGVEALATRLAALKNRNIIIGGNIGKNKTTPNEQAKDDYAFCFEKLFPYVDYFVVNVSSPNTPNLRDLQEKEPLTQLLEHLQTLNFKKNKPKPILLKIAPDLTNSQLDDILDIVNITKIDGVIATNTTISRANLQTNSSEIAEIGNGGLSGLPLKKRSTEVIRYLYQKSGEKLNIIAVGGIESGEDAQEKLQAGAVLVQIYTGMIYGGPSIVKKLNRHLR